MGKLIKKFIEEKVVINDKETLIKHLSKIWDNPYEWWESDKLKMLRIEFNSICSKKSKIDFSEEILLLKKKYEGQHGN